jgi:tRNA(Ile)-lysidine synthase
VVNLLEQIEQSICTRELLLRGQGMLVAVSGGLDSVVLLYLLHALAAKHRWKLTVAHFNHMLRGRASDGDERFVRALCNRLKLPCATARADVQAHAKESGLSVEMAARKLRHEYLARTAKQHRIASIVLAHHADDQVELFFLRLCRGTSSEGLAGMKWRSPSPVGVHALACPDKLKLELQLVRPLLDVGRTELERYARENRIRFREDASNASRDILRNRIRHELLPLLRRRFQPAVSKTVLRLMEILEAESEALAGVTQAWLKSKRPTPFSALPVAVQRRVLQVQLQQRNLVVDFELIEWLRVHPNQMVNVSPLVSVARDEMGLVQLRVHEPAAFNSDQLPMTLGERAGECVFDKVRFQWRLEAMKGSTRLPRRPQCECFAADKVGPQIVLRHWRAGDRFQPIGMLSPVKLQDWFTNRKIPRDRRRQLVVAATAGGEIFWIEGQRIGEHFKLTPQTKRRLIWRWKRL